MNHELERVYLVEDEDDIRVVAQLALEDIGQLTVGYSPDGEDALKKIPEFKPDLILLDVMMPGMDGVETFKQLTQDASLANIPVIFMTAKVQAKEVEGYKALGAIDVIAKPFEPLTLAEEIKTIWANHHAR